MSTPQPVEAISSLAHRTEDGTRVVLHLPDLTVTGDSVTVRFSKPGTRFRHPARVSPASSGVLLDLTVPAPRLSSGVWKLAVQPGSDVPFVKLEARLLTERTQPVALLPGPTPATRMAPPDPRQGPGTVVRTLPARLKRRVRRALSR